MVRKLLWIGCLTTLIWSCSSDDEPSGLNNYDRSVIEYFSEVAFGFEFGGADELTRKWKTEMRVFVGGERKPDLMNELESIINEINDLATDGFIITMVEDSLEMNYYIYLGPGSGYAEIYPSQTSLIEDNWGLFSVVWDNAQNIFRGNMYVDLERANDEEEKHLLREELTQSLGLAKDSKRYEDSIFQEQWTTTTSYSAIDRDLIRLLYHPQMEAGLNPEAAEERLTQIILSEK